MTKKNYDFFVKALPNGLRTILLIVNNQTKNLLIEKFSQVCSHFNNRLYKYLLINFNLISLIENNFIHLKKLQIEICLSQH
jgi:hypothetical protein